MRQKAPRPEMRALDTAEARRLLDAVKGDRLEALLVLLANAELSKSIRFHDLRHTYASIALAQGVHPKIVQEALGHSTIAVTLDLYSHVVPSLQRDAARTMGAVLFG